MMSGTDMGRPNRGGTNSSFFHKRSGKLFLMAISAVTVILTLIALNFVSSPFPIIEIFDVHPGTVPLGEPSTISWKVIGAESILIEPDIGNVEDEGKIEVRPTTSMVYTLYAKNGSIERSESVDVLVEGAGGS